jgi:hypothetical protein
MASDVLKELRCVIRSTVEELMPLPLPLGNTTEFEEVGARAADAVDM